MAYGAFTVVTNISSMNKIVNVETSLLQNKYELKEMDIGEFKKIILKKVLPFYTKLYNIKNLGTFSVMTLNVGIMNIITFNINSFSKDLPQLTIDFMFILNQRKFIFEIYDFMINKEDEKYKNFLKEIEEIKENSNLKDMERANTWHYDYVSGDINKSGNVINDSQFLSILKEIMEAYLKYAEQAPELSDDDMQKKIKLYEEFTDNMAKNGGMAIDNFREGIGEEKTHEYLSKAFYGYSEYQK